MGNTGLSGTTSSTTQRGLESTPRPLGGPVRGSVGFVDSTEIIEMEPNAVEDASSGRVDAGAEERSPEIASKSPQSNIFQRRRGSVDFRAFMPERFQLEVSDYYEVEKKDFASGGYGSVFLANDKQFEDRVVAIKKVMKKNEKLTEDLRIEIAVMKELDHPNICRLLETFESNRNIFFVMEYCEGGELFERIIQANFISEKLSATIVKQVASALKYCHERKIAHRDMKPENICFCSKDPHNTQVKVIDWGLSGLFSQGAMNTAVGSLTYVAPEVICCGEKQGYGESCDLWSLGVLMYVMLCGKPPFWGNQQTMIKRMRAAQYPMSDNFWNSISVDAKDLVRKLLVAKVEDRLGIDGVLRHPWLSGERAAEVDEGVRKAVLENLRGFKGISLFRTFCVASVARQLDHKHLQDIHKVFSRMDENGDGVLSLKEIKEGFMALGAKNKEEAEEIFKAMDIDGSGTIDYTEFCAAAIDFRQHEQDEAVWAAFRSFDIDGNGVISIKELQEMLEKSMTLKDAFSDQVRDEVAKDIFEKYDTNGDGSIDFSEWVELMRGKSGMVEDVEEDDEIQPSLEHREMSRKIANTSSEEAYGLLRNLSGIRLEF